MADNRQNLLNEISDGLRGIRAAINSSNVTIPEDTPLQDYKNYIEEISQTHVDIGKQIFVFYTWAKTVDEALGYDKPSIHWNTETGDGWAVQETNDWQLDKIPDNPNVSKSEPDVTYYTFVMFVSLSIGNSTGDGFDWPTPVQISGSKGEQGDTGLPGRDGVVAGMVLYKTVNLYINSSDKPEIEQGDITFDKENQDIYEMFATDLKINGIRVKDEIGEDDITGQWYSKYPSATYEDMVWMIQVSFKSNNDNTTPEKSPILLIQPVLIADTITDITAKYSYSNEGPSWFDTPQIPTVDNQNCYVKYIITTKYGDAFETDPSVYSQFPKSIVNITYQYGVSDSETNPPTNWNTELPRIGDHKAIWQQRTEHFSDDTYKTVKSPIAIKGNNGVGPYRILTRINKNDLNSWTESQLSILEDKDAVIDESDVLYCWYGTIRPTWSDELDLYEISINDTTYYWLKLGCMGANWDAAEGEPGYVKNRTHYSYNIVKIISDNDNPTCNVPENTKSFIITDANNNVITDCAIIENILHINSEFTFPYTVTFEICKQLDSKFVPKLVEITYDELKLLKGQSKLDPGMQYRITDYETIVSGVLRGTADMVRSAGHRFDIIVTADDVDVLNENARAIQHTSDENDYFHNSNLAAWELKYCLDNDTNRFEWADNSGRGVIYYMKDEFNNECPYDFKNIQSKVRSNIYLYTFYNDDTESDGSLDVTQCSGNCLMGYLVSGVLTLPKIFVRTFTPSHNNIFHHGCHDIHIDCGVGNSFGENCHDIEFGFDCNYNSFGANCYNIQLYGDSMNNKFLGGNSNISSEYQVYGFIFDIGCSKLNIIKDDTSFFYSTVHGGFVSHTVTPTSGKIDLIMTPGADYYGRNNLSNDIVKGAIADLF